MKRFSFRLIIALLAFFLGVNAAALWQFYSDVPNVEVFAIETQTACLCFDSDVLPTIKEHKADRETIIFLEGLVKYKGKTKKNTFYIAPVEESADLSNGQTYIYWKEDNSLLFLNLGYIPKIQDYVADEIYDRDRRDLKRDVVPTEEQAISRYVISKKEADYWVDKCVNNGEKVVVHKESHRLKAE